MRHLPPCCRRLVSRGEIVPGQPAAARSALRAAFAAAGAQLLEGSGVKEVKPGQLVLEDGTEHAFDECLWCTQAGAAAWLRHTGLPTDGQGFLAISDCLQSEGGPAEVFAAGDVASCAKHPRPKAGVYAVRQVGAAARYGMHCDSRWWLCG
jgi:selenide,water dikinase